MAARSGCAVKRARAAAAGSGGGGGGGGGRRVALRWPWLRFSPRLACLATPPVDHVFVSLHSPLPLGRPAGLCARSRTDAGAGASAGRDEVEREQHLGPRRRAPAQPREALGIGAGYRGGTRLRA